MWGRRAAVFLGALILYVICLDRGASLWDCPEYILTAWRLEIGHPPGNPTWQLIANVVSHLGGSAAHAAIAINAMSAVAMALASTFLSGVIFYLLRGSLLRGNSRRLTAWANLAGACGALCYAWCDSAIFSAVEAEVYALSALFTVLMLWLALRWAIVRRRGEVGRARRILILTAYAAGLGVGVHELNFLILPAMALVYLYGARTRWSAASVPTVLWSLLLFIVGTTTYLIIPIRAAANPPVNQGDPSTWKNFKSYYAREQYGSTPLLYGRTPYSKPLRLETVDSAGKRSYNRYYLHENPSGRKEYAYPSELDMWLPRMTSHEPADIEFYEAWAGMTPDEMVSVEVKTAADSMGRQLATVNPDTGQRETETLLRPTYLQQLRYFLGYQVGYMYFRYLLWNFSGRQNNVHSTGAPETGNFITGFTAIDDAMLGSQARLKPSLREGNKGHNRYFMIPFLLGLLGIVALCLNGRRGRRVCAITAVFFLFTGLLIVVYLNQSPGEPRERDYSFLGSYMAFAIWIGAGMAAVARGLMNVRVRRPVLKKICRVIAAAICVCVPLQMLGQTYDDHNRSRQSGAEAIAMKLLLPAPPDAILLASTDNTIFPLWYAQEVLGVRRDVTIVATPYLATEWYRNQLLRPGEGAGPVAISNPVPAGRGGIVDRAIADIRRLNSTRPILRANLNGTLTPVEN